MSISSKGQGEVSPVYSFIYLIFILSVVIDIGGALKVKHLSLLVCLVASVFTFVVYGVNRDYFVEFFLLVAILLAAIYSVSRGVPSDKIFMALSFIGTMVVLPVADRVPGPLLTKIFSYGISLGAMSIVIIFVAILASDKVAVVLHGIGVDYRLGYFGINPAYNFDVPNVYFRWSVLLIPAAIFLAGRNNLLCLLVMLSSFLTLSSAIIAGMIASFGVVAIGGVRSLPVRIGAAICSMLALVALSAHVLQHKPTPDSTIFGGLTSKFSSSSVSTKIKIGHIKGVVDSLSESPINLLWGSGAGSSFYSPGINENVINIEVSHFNMLRQFGLIGFVVVCAYIIYVFVCVSRTDQLGRRWALSIAILFVVAGTNPLLLSPVFFTVLFSARAYSVGYNRMRK